MAAENLTSEDLARWEQRFAAPGYLFGTEPNAFLAREAHRLKAGQTVLALADGEGRNGVFLAARGFDVLAIDFSPKALAKGQALAAERGVKLRSEPADLRTWAWPPVAFDAVVAIFFQFAEPDFRDAIFAGIKRTLKPGGLLLLEGYRPKQLEYHTGGPDRAENLYTRELLEVAFGDFSRIEIKEYDKAIREGTGHDGVSALIDLVGWK